MVPVHGRSTLTGCWKKDAYFRPMRIGFYRSLDVGCGSILVDLAEVTRRQRGGGLAVSSQRGAT